MNNASKPVVLITGAAGRLGRIAVKYLLASGAAHVIAGSRDLSKLADLADLGAELRHVDFDDKNSLAQAFSGVERLLLVSTNDIYQPGKRLDQQLAAVDAAAAAGVGHIAYTSIMNPGAESPIVFADDHRETERAIVRSGVKFTFLRNGFYQENLLLDAPSIQAGTLHTVAGEGLASYVSIADCARAAAAAIGRGVPGCFDITGPSALSIDELMAAAGEAVGKKIKVVQLSDEALAHHLKDIGLPDRIAEIVISHEVATRRNLFSQVSNSVQFLTGKAPEPLAQLFADPAHLAVLSGGAAPA